MTNGKSNEQYWSYVRQRDYWAGQCQECSRQMSQLDNKIERLRTAQRRISPCEGEARNIGQQVSRIPAGCSSWKGENAEKFFEKCTGGDLRRCYSRYVQMVQEAVKAIDSALNRLQSERDALGRQSQSANSQYYDWSYRVNTYWM